MLTKVKEFIVVCVGLFVHAYVCMHVCVSIPASVKVTPMCVLVRFYPFDHAHTHTHTQKHTHTHICNRRNVELVEVLALSCCV